MVADIEITHDGDGEYAFGCNSTAYRIFQATNELQRLGRLKRKLSKIKAHLVYAGLGIPTFPVDAKDHKPLVETEGDLLAVATKEPAVILEWRLRWPASLIGIPVGWVRCRPGAGEPLRKCDKCRTDPKMLADSIDGRSYIVVTNMHGDLRVTSGC